MIFRNYFAIFTLAFLIACSSQTSKPVSQEAQAHIDKAEVKTRLELIVELGAVIQESDLNLRDKDFLMKKFEDFVRDMVMRMAEQNKVTSALINNLSSANAEGMKIQKDLIRRLKEIDQENSEKRIRMVTEISNSLQGKISAEKIAKINALLAQKGFVIIQTYNVEEKPKHKKKK